MVRIFLMGLCILLPWLAVAENQCEDSRWALEQASKLSGISITRPAGCRRLDREQFRSLAHQVILRDLNVKQLPYEAIALKFIGIIPADYDYAKCLVDSYATSAAAFYSPYLHEFIIPDWSQTPRAILVHEAQHVLQDQRYDTRKMGINKFILSDENLAAASVLEGDAMEVENRYVEIRDPTETADLDLSSRLETQASGCALPPLLDQILSAPYDYGVFFVQNVKQKLSDRYRDTIFRRLPRTTREILHYAEYVDKKISLPPVAQHGLFAEHLGELPIRMLLKQNLGMGTGVVAAAGFRFDTLSVTKKGSLYLLSWDTQWQTEKDAEEFANAMTRVTQQRFGIPLSVEAKGWQITANQYTNYKLLRNGINVRLSASIPVN